MSELNHQESDQQEDNINIIDSLSDEEFVGRYPEDGFGWMAPVDQDSPYFAKMEKIGERWAKIRKERPVPQEGMFKPELGVKSPDRSRQDLMQEPYMRNRDGQIVDPRTNAPVRKGSPEWQKLAKRNRLPLDQ
ncbi:MAG TPA: hypothetical protein VI937_02945 [Negativicutes bacterium]|nr:MAG: hypothetical protein A3A12_00025 [Candidatus Staskawiczbacteria bacterium RIFCSPLOWO2_01_FULL_43_17b]HLD70815.1 hypothetical protein [Negativicutes bacterium]